MAAENLRVSIAPDIHPEFLAGWHIFLRHLQKQVEVSMDISSYANFGELRAGLEQGQVDMIFASAADCSYLVLQKNFVALARPESDVTEIVVLCRADAAYQNIEDIEGKQSRIAYADSPEVKHLGLILLEAANVGDGDLVLGSSPSHLLAAKPFACCQAINECRGGFGFCAHRHLRGLERDLAQQHAAFGANPKGRCGRLESCVAFVFALSAFGAAPEIGVAPHQWQRSARFVTRHQHPQMACVRRQYRH